MPYRSYGCSICGKQAPKKLRGHNMSDERWQWIRRHYKKYHPREFKKWYIK